MTKVEELLAHPCFTSLMRPRDGYDGHVRDWEAHFVGKARDGRKEYHFQVGCSAEEASEKAMEMLDRKIVIPLGFGCDNDGSDPFPPGYRSPR